MRSKQSDTYKSGINMHSDIFELIREVENARHDDANDKEAHGET